MYRNMRRRGKCSTEPKGVAVRGKRERRERKIHSEGT